MIKEIKMIKKEKIRLGSLCKALYCYRWTENDNVAVVHPNDIVLVVGMKRRSLLSKTSESIWFIKDNRVQKITIPWTFKLEDYFQKVSK